MHPAEIQNTFQSEGRVLFNLPAMYPSCVPILIRCWVEREDPLLRSNARTDVRWSDQPGFIANFIAKRVNLQVLKFRGCFDTVNSRLEPRIFDREVGCDQQAFRPIQEPRWKTVMLPENHPLHWSLWLPLEHCSRFEHELAYLVLFLIYIVRQIVPLDIPARTRSPDAWSELIATLPNATVNPALPELLLDES